VNRGSDKGQPMKRAIGSDHSCFNYTEEIMAFLKLKCRPLQDFSTNSSFPADYPCFFPLNNFNFLNNGFIANIRKGLQV
jgi:hypothetical protein